jgi:hypothetical protein
VSNVPASQAFLFVERRFAVARRVDTHCEELSKRGEWGGGLSGLEWLLWLAWEGVRCRDLAELEADAPGDAGDGEVTRSGCGFVI